MSKISEKYVERILETNENVSGEIYWMFCKQSQKGYVGQTLSHRLNRKKYRPFGFKGRFRDHFSEAINNTKTKQCQALNCAIRKYPDLGDWNIVLVMRCPPSQMDTLEIAFIKAFDCYAPRGYNLTRGGKGAMYERENVITNTSSAGINSSWRSEKKPDETKQKMSRIAKELSTPEMIQKRSDSASNQHMAKRLERFADCKPDADSFDYYTTHGTYKGSPQVILKIDDLSTRFIGEKSSECAKQFFDTLIASTLK